MYHNNDRSLERTLAAETTSGDKLSLWFLESAKPIAYETLQGNIDTDILVIGGGISGLTTAYILAKENRKVVLIDDGFIGSGESGRTTAHLTCVLEQRYYELEDRFDRQTAELIANSHIAAIEWISNTIARHKIDCHFKRVNGYLFLHSTDKRENLEREFKLTESMGLQTEMMNATPYMINDENQACIKFPDQAQFHVLLYLKHLAEEFIKFGGTIYTQTHADEINSKGAIGEGFKINANHIVVATNSPVNDRVVMHTKQWPYRTYVIAGKIAKKTLPYALWWDTGDYESKWLSRPYHYVRLESYNDDYNFLIIGGEDHKTGQADDEGISEQVRYENLEDWAKIHFPSMESIEFRWSGQIIAPIDGVAYLGKNPGDDNIYIITGDNGNGMTHGTLGGMIVSDIILGKNNPWIDLYDPSRITWKSTKDFLHEAGNMVAQFADWFSFENSKEAEELEAGEGAVISVGLKKIAVYRDQNNSLHSFSAVCPHLGAILQWNPEEKSFDCPMHGSRFNSDGIVINGPSRSNLKRLHIEEHSL
jgi:glycine/D-amino acid oxidase-like deaminating enzyme/nitrite reductase/ring-hydroxylating ferredoxin subunit